MEGFTNYALLRDLLIPAKPSDKSLDDLFETLKKHFDPTSSVLGKRFNFYCCSQGNSEGIAEYVAELKCLATHCSFEAYVDEALRDRFVFGLKQIAIQNRLLAEKNLTFTTVEIAQSMERVDTQAKIIQGERRGVESENEKVYSPNSKGGGTQCYHCGRSNHIHSQCRFKNAVCHCCKKCGHLQVMCRKKAEQISTEPTRLRPVMKAQKQNNSKMKWMSVSDDDDSLASFNLQRRESPPYQVKVLINNKNVLMEIDMGAAVTLMSINEFRELFPRRQLQKLKLTLKTCRRN